MFAVRQTMNLRLIQGGDPMSIDLSDEEQDFLVSIPTTGWRLSKVPTRLRDSFWTLFHKGMVCVDYDIVQLTRTGRARKRSP